MQVTEALAAGAPQPPGAVAQVVAAVRVQAAEAAPQSRVATPRVVAAALAAGPQA